MGLGSFVSKAVGSITGGDLLSFGGSLISGGLSYAGQNSANAASLASTREQMEFQKEMRATQYQTAVEDLKKAGLNPMLAYQQGGSGNLSGASYTAQNAMGAGVNSANETKMAMNALLKGRAEIKNLNEQNKLIPVQVENTVAQARQADSQARLNDTSAFSASEMLADNQEAKRAEANYYKAAMVNQLQGARTNAAQASAYQADTAIKAAKLPREKVHSSVWKRGGKIVDDIITLPETVYEYYLKPKNRR